MAFFMFNGMPIAPSLALSVMKPCKHKGKTMASCDYPDCYNKKFIAEAIKLAEEMLRMAEKGILSCKDDSCLLLYGVIRDCGYKIRKTVEEEQAYTMQNTNRQNLLH